MTKPTTSTQAQNRVYQIQTQLTKEYADYTAELSTFGKDVSEAEINSRRGQISAVVIGGIIATTLLIMASFILIGIATAVISAVAVYFINLPDLSRNKLGHSIRTLNEAIKNNKL